MDSHEGEIDYYRKVEDLFAGLRGTPHVLSPRDFQLLRGWWRDGVPFSAVVTGLTEVFTRIRNDPDADPVVSLSYCRHAVARHAKRIAEMHIGAGETIDEVEQKRDSAGVHELAAELEEAAAAHRERWPVVADAITRIAKQIAMANDELPAALLDEHLFGLESTLLHDCWNALEEDQRRAVDQRIEQAVRSSSTTEEARERSRRALRDREVRLLLNLPRLELDR